MINLGVAVHKNCAFGFERFKVLIDQSLKDLMSVHPSNRLLNRTSNIIAITAVLVLGLSMGLFSLNRLQLIISGVSCATLIALAILIKRHSWTRKGAQLLVSTMLTIALALSWSSGGLWSPIVFLFPALPLMANLLLRAPAGWHLCIVLAAFFVWEIYLYWSNHPAPSLTSPFFERLSWIVLGTLLSATLSAIFCFENASRILIHFFSI